MNTEPVSYDSLKTVLQYMEANVRFQLSTCIPSIRSAEKAVPLKISDLTFDGMKVVVDKTEYNLGVHRKYHDDAEHVPNNIQLDNDNDDAQYNFGLLDWSSVDKIMTPGDVDIGTTLQEKNLIACRTNEVYMQNIGTQVRQYEEEVAQGTPAARAEYLINELRPELQLYHCWRDNTPLPFDMLIEFTVTSESGEQKQLMRYNKRIQEAQKHLNTLFFGKRRFPIQIRCLNVDSMTGRILRLPVDLKFKIQKVIISKKFAETYEGLKPILEESSFPLNCLNIVRWSEEEDFGHAIITSAKKLVVSNAPMDFWLRTLQNLPNQRVHFKVIFSENEDYIRLIQNWLDTGRQVDTYYSFEIKGYQGIWAALLRLIRQRFNGAISEERSVTLRMNPAFNLKVSHEADIHDRTQWILTMKVIRHEA